MRSRLLRCLEVVRDHRRVAVEVGVDRRDPLSGRGQRPDLTAYPSPRLRL